MNTQQAGKKPAETAERDAKYVTIRLGGQVFGLPIGRVEDVFVPDNFTHVPLAGRAVAGVLNLRGRIVTAIDLSEVMGVPALNDEQALRPAVNVQYLTESYGLLTDTVGEVISLGAERLGPNPINLNKGWARISLGTAMLEDELMVVLDVDALIQDILGRELGPGAGMAAQNSASGVTGVMASAGESA